MSKRYFGFSIPIWIAIGIGIVVLVGIPLVTDRFTTFGRTGSTRRRSPT